MADSRVILLVAGSSRSGSTNVSVLRTAATLLPAGVGARMLEGIWQLPLYTPDDDVEGTVVDARVAAMRATLAGAAVVAEACARVPVTREMVDDDGLIGDPSARAAIAAAVSALARSLGG